MLISALLDARIDDEGAHIKLHIRMGAMFVL
jgi:hypothetical protein